MKERVLRINQLLKELIGKMILNDFDFQADNLVTVTRVETTKDLQKANVFISVYPEKNSDKILSILKKREKFFHFRIRKMLKMKIIPNIFFKKEKKVAQAAKIEKILLDLKNKN